MITKNKVEGQMAIWTRKNGMAVNNYLAVKKPVRPCKSVHLDVKNVNSRS